MSNNNKFVVTIYNYTRTHSRTRTSIIKIIKTCLLRRGTFDNIAPYIYILRTCCPTQYYRPHVLVGFLSLSITFCCCFNFVHAWCVPCTEYFNIDRLVSYKTVLLHLFKYQTMQGALKISGILAWHVIWRNK